MEDEKYCNKCGTSLRTASNICDLDSIFCLLDQIWTCRKHASEHLHEIENRLLNSTNRATSITEQRMLDDIQVLKMRYKAR
ncbi:MAG: hypothetical protein VX478_08010 [Chloroflexota bacterium]|nr:hypothetical protein [Chloroflexota bacterium]